MKEWQCICMFVDFDMYIYIYICVCVCVCMYLHFFCCCRHDPVVLLLIIIIIYIVKFFVQYVYNLKFTILQGNVNNFLSFFYFLFFLESFVLYLWLKRMYIYLLSLSLFKSFNQHHNI